MLNRIRYAVFAQLLLVTLVAAGFLVASGQGGAVGAFEGGNYMAEGIYRSQQNCIMFTRTTDFCAVCAEAIEKVIDEYSLQ